MCSSTAGAHPPCLGIARGQALVSEGDSRSQELPGERTERVHVKSAKFAGIYPGEGDAELVPQTVGPRQGGFVAPGLQVTR